jgi:hypothetical protein
MDDLEYHAKLDTLDHMLNDDDPVEPTDLWDLLAEVSHHDLQQVGHV